MLPDANLQTQVLVISRALRLFYHIPLEFLVKHTVNTPVINYFALNTSTSQSKP